MFRPAPEAWPSVPRRAESCRADDGLLGQSKTEDELLVPAACTRRVHALGEGLFKLSHDRRGNGAGWLARWTPRRQRRRRRSARPDATDTLPSLKASTQPDSMGTVPHESSPAATSHS